MPEREVTILAKLTDKLSGPLKKMSSGFAFLGRAAKAAGTVASGALTLVGRSIRFVTRSIFNLRNLLLAGAFAGIIKVFADFERGLANVATLVDTNVVSMQELRDTVIEVSKTTGEGLDSLNRALFDVISAGVEARQAGAVLLEASRLAKGGATSTAAATKGLVSVMNSYGLTVADVTDLSDSFFQAQKAGITTIEDLSRSIGRVAPVAKISGLSIDEMLAAVAALTKGGLSTQEAVTSLRSVMTGLIKPTEQAKDAARKLEIQFDSSRLKGGKFADFLVELAQKTGLNESVLTKLFGNVKAFSAVANLATDDAKSFRDILGSMADKAGATAEAVEKVEQTTSDKIRTLLANIKVFFVQIGEAAKPFIDGAVKKFEDFIKGLSSKQSQIQAIIGQISKAIGQVFKIIGSIFREGDVIRFVINIITGGIEAGVKTVIAALPLITRIAQRIGREFAIALIDTIFGTGNEEIARKLASGKRGFFRAGIRVLGLDEAEVENLARLGRQLSDAEKNLEIQRARGAQAPEGSEARRLFERAVRDVENVQKQLAGSAFREVREQDSALLNEQTKIFLGETKQIASAYFASLPDGLSKPTQDAMEKLGNILGDEWTQAINDAKAKDEKKREEKAKEAGEEIGKAFGEGVGTGIQEGEGGGINIDLALAELEGGLEKVKSSMEEFRKERQRLRSLADEGFIGDTERLEREKEQTEAITKEIGLLEDRLTSLRSEADAPVLALIGEQMELVTEQLAKFKKEISESDELRGTFFTGLTAGISRTVEKMADLRQTGLELGRTLATGLGDAVITAFEKGKEGLRAFASEFFSTIARMIARAIIFQAIMAGLSAIGGPFASIGAGIGQAAAGRALGGPVHGPPGTDVIPARLTAGEFIQPKGVVDHYGEGIMEAIRRRLIPRSALAMWASGIPAPRTNRLEAGGMPSGGSAIGPAKAYVVANEQTLDRLLAAGPRAFRRFIRDNAKDIKAELGI